MMTLKMPLQHQMPKVFTKKCNKSGGSADMMAHNDILGEKLLFKF
jgi:hypothetical protein